VDRCDACLGHFCAACFVRQGARLLCRECTELVPLRAAQAAQARRLGPRLRAALRDRQGGLVAAAALVAVLGSAAALSVLERGSGGSAISRALADDPAVVQRAWAARYCATGEGVSGSVPTPVVVLRSGGSGAPGGNPVARGPTGALLAAVAGVLPDTLLRDDRIAGTPGLPDPYDPMNLTRYWDTGGVGWRSRTGLFPQQVGLELRGQVTVDRLAFRHTRAAPAASWAKDVGVLLTTASPEGGYYQVGRWTLQQTTEPQEFVFVETSARYVRVCLYTNHGHPEFVSLGTVALGVMPPPALIATQALPLLPKSR
jgi:hypothetical protein